MELFKEPTRYDAVVQLFDEKYPKIEKAKVIITDDGESVLVGARALYTDMTKEEDRIYVTSKQVGDYVVIFKNDPIHKLLDALNTVLNNVSDLVERGKQGRLNESDNL